MEGPTSIEHALQMVKECELGRLTPQKTFVRENCELLGDLGHRLLSTMESGAVADYVNTGNQFPRTRGLPRNDKYQSETIFIFGGNYGKILRTIGRFSVPMLPLA